jgi:hypothetical protein
MSYDKLIQQMDAKLQFPGLSNTWTMPVENRLDMELTGIKTPIGIKVQGPSIDGIQQVAAQIQGILSGLPQVRLCVAYRIDGHVVEEFPSSGDLLARAEPVYETVDGWDADLGGVRRSDQLPPAARRYVDALEQLAGVPISIVSVGADRTATILRRERPRRPPLSVPALAADPSTASPAPAGPGGTPAAAGDGEPSAP